MMQYIILSIRGMYPQTYTTRGIMDAYDALHAVHAIPASRGVDGVHHVVLLTRGVGVVITSRVSGGAHPTHHPHHMVRGMM